MNRINQIFQEKDKGLLSLYFCAGHPTLDSTADIIKALEQYGIDFIEVGIPFSDPMADGPVIQDAATKALRNGMSLKKLFSQLEGIRSDVNMPLLVTPRRKHQCQPNKNKCQESISQTLHCDLEVAFSAAKIHFFH